MRIDAGIKTRLLIYRCTDCPVAADSMHSQSAWIVVSRQQMGAAAIETGVDRPRRQRRRLAVRMKCAGCGIDGKSVGEMLVAGSPGAAIAGDHVEVTPRFVRPGILDIGRQRD